MRLNIEKPLFEYSLSKGSSGGGRATQITLLMRTLLARLCIFVPMQARLSGSIYVKGFPKCIKPNLQFSL